MTAVTAGRERAQAAETLPAVESMTARQQSGIDCALCGSYLGPHARDLGAIWDGHGGFLYLYGCAERCQPPRRIPGAAWPADGPPANVGTSPLPSPPAPTGPWRPANWRAAADAVAGRRRAAPP